MRASNDQRPILVIFQIESKPLLTHKYLAVLTSVLFLTVVVHVQTSLLVDKFYQTNSQTSKRNKCKYDLGLNRSEFAAICMSSITKDRFQLREALRGKFKSRYASWEQRMPINLGQGQFDRKCFLILHSQTPTKPERMITTISFCSTRINLKEIRPGFGIS